jgi:hypothetical protein
MHRLEPVLKSRERVRERKRESKREKEREREREREKMGGRNEKEERLN